MLYAVTVLFWVLCSFLFDVNSVNILLSYTWPGHYSRLKKIVN